MLQVRTTVRYFQQYQRTGFTIRLIWMLCTQSIFNGRQNTFVIFYHNRDAKPKKDSQNNAKLQHTLTCTHTDTHTQPNLPHISLTVLSEDVYRLARDLFPIWQSQEHLNGLWKKMPSRIFIWIFAGQALFQRYSHTFPTGLMPIYNLVIRSMKTSQLTPKCIMRFICPTC